MMVLLWLLLATLIIQPLSLKSCLYEERLALLEINTYMKSFVEFGDVFQGIDDNEAKQYDNCCAWERVRCDPTSHHVTGLNLGSMISRESSWSFNVTFLSPFLYLISLDLSENSLSALVDKNGSTRISTLRNLQVLKLNGNYFETDGIKFGSLTLLKKLNLSDCGLDESVFPVQELANLRELQVLDLSLNEFQYIIQGLANLSKLQVLDLSNNLIAKGSIEGLCELKSLQKLHFGNNKFYGDYPSCVSNLTSLQVIDLPKNLFQGKLTSDTFTNLISLHYLDVSDNNFEGNLNLASFANHSNLTVLRLSGNRLDVQTDDLSWQPSFQLQSLGLKGCHLNKPIGSIPKFLSYQYDLRDIDLSSNNLTGKFPAWLINNNSQLVTLLLNNNSLKGYFYLPYLSPHLLLEKIDMSNNKLRGVLSKNIGLMLPRVAELNMSGNSFEGNVPDSMGKMTQLEIVDLSRNNFSGKLPVQLMSDCSKMSILQLSDNSLQGDIIPEQMNLPDLFWIKLNNNRFSGRIKDPLLRSPRLNHLDISGNEVIGGLPSWIGNFSTLLTLAMSNNLLQGTIPAEICQIPLSYLDLSSNNLIGSVPSCLFSTTILYLRNNNLTGPLPNAISRSSNVNILDLSDNQFSGSIPTPINNLYGLQVLLLRGNNLQGQIPNQLCELQDISILDLSHNKLTGGIPSCLGNMFHGTKHITPFNKQVVYPANSGSDLYSIPEEVDILVKHNYLKYIGDDLVLMIELDISCNKLTGVIPPQLGNLMQVHSLNLSHNSLSGSIPSSFSNLKQAESVDLSYNKLNGSIPLQLIQLQYISCFNVSYNYLRGKVPDGGQFGKLDESNFIGNPQLCGLLVYKSCNTVIPPSSYDNSTKSIENGDVEEDFFWSFGVSCGITFVTTAVILCINPRWREAWFEFVGWHLLWWLPFDFL